MNRLAIGAALVTIAFGASPAAIVAAQEMPLAKVAAQLGFDYSYLGPEDAVSLMRPGVTIVVRPGERLFDVNDRTEAMDGAAPHFSRDDIVVSSAFIARLRQIAFHYPANAPIVLETYGARTVSAAGATAQAAAAARPATGAITGLSVSQVSGQQEIAVGGKAPANLPITLTLVSTFSSELPDVVLSRHEVTADADGRFKASLPIASGFYRGSILTLVATSLPGISSAKTQIVMKAPNGSVPIPADQIPNSIR